METRNKFELAEELCAEIEKDPFLEEIDQAGTAYLRGFDAAKAMIIQFLTQKSLGYDNAYFFKMEDLKSLGESHIYTDEPLKESERIAKWDWSTKSTDLS